MSSSREAVRLYSIPDVAAVLGVSRNYVYQRINSRELRVVELSNGSRPKQRVRQDDLDAFIDGRTHTRQVKP